MRQNRSEEDYIKYVVEETKPNIKLILKGQSCSVANFRSCHAYSQDANIITYGDSQNLTASMKSIKL